MVLSQLQALQLNQLDLRGRLELLILLLHVSRRAPSQEHPPLQSNSLPGMLNSSRGRRAQHQELPGQKTPQLLEHLPRGRQPSCQVRLCQLTTEH